MAGSVNKVILVGRLARDVEVRHTASGTPIVNMTVATSERWRDKDSGESKERSEFHRVVIFNDRLATVAQAYLRKGSNVYLEGALQTRKWTDQSGADRYSTEVVLQRYRGELTLLDPPRQEGPGRSPPAVTTGEPGGDWQAPAGSVDLDDSIPFAPMRELP